MLITMLRDFVASVLIPLFALTVKLNVPVTVGVPEITPAVESDNPSGKLPVLMLHVIGMVPEATSIWL